MTANVVLKPARGNRQGAFIFSAELKRVGGRWRMDSFVPVAQFGQLKGTKRLVAASGLHPAGAQRQGGAEGPDLERLARVPARRARALPADPARDGRPLAPRGEARRARVRAGLRALTRSPRRRDTSRRRERTILPAPPAAARMGNTMKKTAVLAALALGLLATTAAAGNPHAERTRLTKADMALAQAHRAAPLRPLRLLGVGVAAALRRRLDVPRVRPRLLALHDHRPPEHRLQPDGRAAGRLVGPGLPERCAVARRLPPRRPRRGRLPPLPRSGREPGPRADRAEPDRPEDRSGDRARARRAGRASSRSRPRLHAAGRTIPLYADLVSFQRGRVQVGLMFTTLGTRLRDRLAAARAVDRRIPR